MAFTGKDAKIPVLVHIINQSIFMVDAAAPTVAIFEMFRLSYAIRQSVSVNILNQFVNLFGNLSVLFDPLHGLGESVILKISSHR